MATVQLLVIRTLLPEAMVSVICGQKTGSLRSICPGWKPTNWLTAGLGLTCDANFGSLTAKWLNPINGSNTHQHPALYQFRPSDVQHDTMLHTQRREQLHKPSVVPVFLLSNIEVQYPTFNGTPRCPASSKLASH